MPAAVLEFSYTGYNQVATLEQQITVLGEEGATLEGIETVITVPLSQFRTILQYDSNWSDAQESGYTGGVQPHPEVLFRPAEPEAGTKLFDFFTRIQQLGIGPAADRAIADDDATQIPILGKTFLDLDASFTNSILDDNELPRAAIRKIEDMGLTGFATTATTLFPSLGTTGASYQDEYTSGLLKGLFEQAVNANRVLTTDGATGAQAGFKTPSFEVDDEIRFNIRYTCSKTRKYALDGSVEGVDNEKPNTLPAGYTITIGGNTFTIDNTMDISGNSTNETASGPVNYQVVLRAIADV